ncbi:hypothetical protein A3Q56_06558 [Intoshia linei]|uniref:FERM domain-containing protein n=1 Tax=Intoshia linei TaxID=1819745 RepID=A0A177AWY8_9BILA|nr:hypothetical protein A3Q56_06558 [Intoshia linei]
MYIITLHVDLSPISNEIITLNLIKDTLISDVYNEVIQRISIKKSLISNFGLFIEKNHKRGEIILNPSKTIISYDIENGVILKFKTKIIALNIIFGTSRIKCIDLDITLSFRDQLHIIAKSFDIKSYENCVLFKIPPGHQDLIFYQDKYNTVKKMKMNSRKALNTELSKNLERVDMTQCLSSIGVSSKFFYKLRQDYNMAKLYRTVSMDVVHTDYNDIQQQIVNSKIFCYKKDIIYLAALQIICDSCNVKHLRNRKYINSIKEQLLPRKYRYKSKFLNKIIKQHAKFDLSVRSALIEYIKYATSMTTFGYNFFYIREFRGNSLKFRKCYFGISPDGVLLLESKVEKELFRLPLSAIEKFHIKENEFLLKTKTFKKYFIIKGRFIYNIEISARKIITDIDNNSSRQNSLEKMSMYSFKTFKFGNIECDQYDSVMDLNNPTILQSRDNNEKKEIDVTSPLAIEALNHTISTNNAQLSNHYKNKLCSMKKIKIKPPEKYDRSVSITNTKLVTKVIKINSSSPEAEIVSPENRKICDIEEEISSILNLFKIVQDKLVSYNDTPKNSSQECVNSIKNEIKTQIKNKINSIFEQSEISKSGCDNLPIEILECCKYLVNRLKQLHLNFGISPAPPSNNKLN